MPIDASIPLQVRKPEFMTPAQGLSLQNLVQTNQMEKLQLAQAMRSEQDRTLIQQVMGNLQNYESDGTMRLDAIQKLAAISPDAYQKALNNRFHLQQEQRARDSTDLQNKLNAGQITQRFTNDMNALNEQARAAVADLAAKGASPTVLNEEFKRARREIISKWFDSGAASYLPREPVPSIPDLPTQEQARQNILAYEMTFPEATARKIGPEGITEQQRKAEADKRAAEAATRAAEDQAMQRKRLGMEEERLALEKKRSEQAKVPAEIQRSEVALRALDEGLIAYMNELKKIDPRSLDQLNPDKQVQIKALLADLIINWKEAGQLGALTGPDVGIIERALTDPFTMKGAWYGKDGLLNQIEAAQETMRRRKKALTDKYGIQFPEQPSAAPQAAPRATQTPSGAGGKPAAEQKPKVMKWKDLK